MNNYQLRKQNKIKNTKIYYDNLISIENIKYSKKINKIKIQAYTDINKLFFPQQNENLTPYLSQRRLNQISIENKYKTIENIILENNTKIIDLEEEKNNEIYKLKKEKNNIVKKMNNVKLLAPATPPRSTKRSKLQNDYSGGKRNSKSKPKKSNKKIK
tara:strand:- start:559 stop:1032 length:474 start_codon:yes stop_codon:yes gene_type:complete